MFDKFKIADQILSDIFMDEVVLKKYTSEEELDKWYKTWSDTAEVYNHLIYMVGSEYVNDFIKGAWHSMTKEIE